MARLSADDVFDSVQGSAAANYICKQLRRLNEIMDAEVETRDDLFYDVLFPVFHVTPILYDVLSIRHGSDEDEIHLRQRECFRLACILYLCNIRSIYDFEPGSAMPYGSKLILLLGTPDLLPRWEKSNVYLLWILTVAASSATLFESLRKHYVAFLSESVRAAGIANFDEFSALIRGFVWSEAAFGEALRALKSQIKFNA